MSLISKIVGALLALVVVALGVLAITISHNSEAGPAPVLPANAVRMQAIVYRQYGDAEVLKLEQVAKPTPAANELLIKVHDAALNPLDWHFMHGTPYLVRFQTGFGRPKFIGIGVDFSGTVEAVGPDVKQFKVGDEIFGTANGALAEYVTSTAVGLSLKPSNMTFQQTAAVPIAGFTALQGLRDGGQLKPGQKVLINGASGGVGTFAVQIAKSMGAEVTGVCSTRNLDLVRSLGADHVIDYTKEDFTKGAIHYDLIFDTVGNHPFLDYRRVLVPHGTLVVIGGGGPSSDPWIEPLMGFIKAAVLNHFVSQRFTGFLADANKTSDLDTLRDMMQAGKLVPAIDRQYPLSEAPAAMRYLEAGHARGKVIVSLQ
jgi:NADPH:quinone reductase-like Zn-dependent oxidoreductase